MSSDLFIGVSVSGRRSSCTSVAVVVLDVVVAIVVLVVQVLAGGKETKESRFLKHLGEGVSAGDIDMGRRRDRGLWMEGDAREHAGGVCVG